MAPEYASEQPQGFKNKIEKVAIVGAGGQSGKYITEALLKNGKHSITAVTRAGSNNKLPQGVTAREVDYDDQSSLVEALKGQDALIITMNVMAPKDQQAKLIEAAAAAKVPWVLPNEFGGGDFNEQASKDTFLGIAKKQDRDLIEKLGKSSWIGIACSFWYEYSLGGGPYRYGFDFKNKSARFFDDGTTPINTSTWPQTGLSVANLLALKVLPDDANDKSPCLANFRNKFVYVSSFTVSQKDMLDSVLRVTGASVNDWKISYKPVKEVFQEGLEKFQAGNRIGFAELLYSRAFFPDKAGNFEATTGLDNDKLGLPKEDLDQFTKVGIHLAESGYFDHEGA